MLLNISSVLVLLATVAFSASEELDRRTKELMDKMNLKFAEFQCYKEQSCRHGGDKVCAVDHITNEIAVFEDICTVYKANCKKVGKYLRVTMDACDAKKKYQAEHGDKFDWQPIPAIPSNRADPRNRQKQSDKQSDPSKYREDTGPLKKHFKIIKGTQI